LETADQRETRRRVRAEAERVLRANWRTGRRRSDGVPYAFTCPATPRYRHQWYWDSCFHAIAWRHFDAARAREELRTLARGGRLDGFIPHTVFWDRPAYWRRAPFYGTHTVFGCSATSTIQTPLLALAWELVAHASAREDPEFAAEGLSQLRLHYDWLASERDPEGDGLLTTFVPDESGLDDSPKYDEVFGWMRHDSIGHTWLIERSRRLGYDAGRIVERYDEHVEDVVVNVFYALSLRALARLDDEHGATYDARAARTEQALLDRCYDERTGLFYDLAGRGRRQIRVSTWSSLAPLALAELPEEIRRRLVEEQLLDSRRYAAPCGVPSVSQDEPTFNPGFALWRCWRGPSWVNTAWLLTPAMRSLGYDAEADRIVDSLARAAAQYGLREYYNPFTGRGLAARDFGMSTLLIDLFANSGDDACEPSAAERIMQP
jgi:hypothetical protein